MASIDVYKQYFSANCIYNNVVRHGACVWLMAESDSGNIRYEVGVTFFPHNNEEDYAISYDACVVKELLNTKGRRSKKRDQEYLEQVRIVVDEITKTINGTIYWDQPLRDAEYN